VNIEVMLNGQPGPWVLGLGQTYR